MKANFKYLAMAVVALMSMSACNNEMDEQLPEKEKGMQPVKFEMTLGGTNTRTVTGTDAARTTTWSEGDAVGIFVYKAGTTEAVKANMKYVLTGNTWAAADASNEIYPEAAYDYYAYYPYQESVTNPTQISISAKADQSATSGADYGASDVLASQNKNVSANVATVPLVFKHMFAMVEVKVSGDKVTQQPVKVQLKGVKLDVNLDIMAATPAATLKASATATDVTMYYLTKTENPAAAPFSFRAVVPAQEIAAETPLVAIYDVDGSGKTYTMQHTAAVPYEVGKFRLLNVTIGTNKVSLEIPKTDLTISPWGTSDAVNGNGSEVVAPLINPLTGNLTDVVANPTALSENTWFGLKRVAAEPNVTYSVIDDSNTDWKKAAQLSYTSIWNDTKAINNSWYIGTLGYLRTTPLDVSVSNIYKLTLKIKANTNEKASISKLMFTFRNASNTHSYLVATTVETLTAASGNKATTVSKAPANADTWETFSIYINLSKKSTTVGSILEADVNSKVIDSTPEDYSRFDLRVYTNDAATASKTSVVSTISISDVILEPYIVVK